MPAPDFKTLRADFPMLKMQMHGKPLIYLDSAATTMKPDCVIDTITRFYREQYGTVHRAIYEIAILSTRFYQETRQKIQHFLHAAKPEEIIFTRGTTESINTVAYSFGKAFVKPGDEILISGMEHHSNLVPWQILCEDRGAILKVIPLNERGEILLDEYAQLLSEKTRLVALTLVSNSLGTINPIKKMVELAHAAGAKVLIDAAQAASHMAIDVQDLDCDFLAFSGHKTLGPTGIGILYGKEALLEIMPPYQGGGDMIDTVTFEKTTYNTLPLKFEAGTPLIAEVIGLGSAIDYLTAADLPTIQAYEYNLLLQATEKMSEIEGLKIMGTATDKGAIVSFNVERIHPLDLGTLLDLQGVAIRTGHLCAQPVMRRYGMCNGVARVSFAFYNTQEEIDQFVEMLKASIEKLRR